MLTLLDTFAGPICFSPATEKDEFALLAMIATLLIAAQWFFLIIWIIVFKARHTLNQKRLGILKVIFGLEMLMGTCLYVGNMFAGNTSDNGLCPEPINTSLGTTLQIISFGLLLISLIIGIVFLFAYNEKNENKEN